MVVLMCIVAAYGGFVFINRHKESESLSVCRDWYRGSFKGWQKWPSLTPDKKLELEKLNPTIEDTISSACRCIYMKSSVFRETIIPQFFVADTDSFIDLEKSEVKKYQAECHIPDFFTWKVNSDLSHERTLQPPTTL